jgi:hypothetical protein
MKRAAIAVIAITLALEPAAAAKCHHFSIWKYPWRQSCRMTALAPSSIRSRARINVILPVPRPIEIPLPDLTNIDWGQLPDDDARGRLMLRATLQGKEDK